MKRCRRFIHWLAHPRLPDEHGYAMAFWAIFLGTATVPLMVLAWDVGWLIWPQGDPDGPLRNDRPHLAGRGYSCAQSPLPEMRWP